MSQDDKILDYLRSGRAITPAKANALFGCLALHSAISRLRDRSLDIPCTIRTGNGKRWGSYTLLMPK